LHLTVCLGLSHEGRYAEAVVVDRVDTKHTQAWFKMNVVLLSMQSVYTRVWWLNALRSSDAKDLSNDILLPADAVITL